MVAPNTKRNMALNLLINYFDHTPRRVLALMSAACVGLLLFGLYLQEVVGLVPCPMCIVQRYALILIAVCAGLAGASDRKGLQIGGSYSYQNAFLCW